MNDQILVTTMNDLPGYEVVGVYGEVFGLVARARNMFSNMGAGLRTISGGEAKGYTKLLSDSRDQAVERLRAAAAARGANAVIAMRFDCNEIANMISEVAAYGTAVVVRPVGQTAAPGAPAAEVAAPPAPTA
ncbi:MAG: YbjQ family protein [Solirubrobacterales bacterium]